MIPELRVIAKTLGGYSEELGNALLWSKDFEWLINIYFNITTEERQGQGLTFGLAVLFPQHLEQHLAHGRHPVNVG